ncbi:MAG: deoxyguanosinetriphosphate triphosphohydrolase [Planctomycetes bacterium]|nr:deoxyguanosinetriphosphate triphosphohydrolase [Planctomycetota bacterium]
MKHSPAPTPPHFFDRRAKEARERAILAPWAMHSGLSLGRAHPEEEDELRTGWERDRDRIVHSVAFRRLMYKTQVFVNWEGDHYRTRMSHSLEVAQVARSVGSALFLNETLCEAVALAHDIGHPPFGHRGEQALDALMEPFGGFRHNAQVLRVVDQLERRSPDYPGLNLTREVRESLLKHESDTDWPAEFRPRPQRPCLEAQVVDLADSTAYNGHDIEDGLRSQVFHEEDLAEVALWNGARAAVEARHLGFLDSTTDQNLRVKRIANELLKICIKDLIRSSHERLQQARPESPTEVKAKKSMLIDHSAALAKEVGELQRFLYEHVYRHPKLLELSQHAAEVLAGLFGAFCKRPEEMPPWYQRWVGEVGKERAVCDYLAGMTDRFAEQEFERLTGHAPAWKRARG